MDLVRQLHRMVDSLERLPLMGGLVERRAREAFVANRDQNLFYGVHETWDEAAEAARSFGKVGYDDEVSAAIYDHRVRIDQHDYPSLYWITRSLHEGLTSVFDVGGSIGIKYLAFTDVLSEFPKTIWRVQDVPAMVQRGRESSRQRGDDQFLQFTDRFEEGDGLDLLFASGVLQYLPETLDALLSKFTNLPKRILINTAAIHPVKQFFTVNSIGTAFCPYRIQTQANLIRGLSALGYRLRETWANPDKPLIIPNRPEFSLRQYSGYCLDRIA
jgi:putative methyltransferase (TIGR04325 family)